MSTRIIGSIGFWMVLLNLSAGAAAATTPLRVTALDAYIAAVDPNYSYEIVRTIPGKGFRMHVLSMTSQKWLTEEEVDRPLWQHWLTLIQPDKVKHSKALLFVGGGKNGGDAPAKPEPRLAQIALRTGSVVAALGMIPNQPLVFAGSQKGLSEDALIAYAWDKYLRSGEAKWLPRLPMTKSVVRAMDTLIDFCGGEKGGGIELDGFVVAGGSKRGWTTWTTALVDPRVVAIIPMVIDMLNVEPSFQHHYQVYGFFAPAVRDYEAAGIMDWLNTAPFLALLRIVEPYEYRDRLVMPKFLINSTGDQFFVPDSSQFYFQDLPGPKFLRYVPNADHSLKNSDAVETILTCYDAILNQAPLPRFDWDVKQDGTIRVRSQDAPATVKLWQASNANARDFRLDVLGPAWKSIDLKPEADGAYEARPPTPARGWTAFMVELTYPSSGSQPPFKFTTEVNVVPDKLPFKPFTPNQPNAL